MCWYAFLFVCEYMATKTCLYLIECMATKTRLYLIEYMAAKLYLIYRVHGHGHSVVPHSITSIAIMYLYTFLEKTVYPSLPLWFTELNKCQFCWYLLNQAFFFLLLNFFTQWDRESKERYCLDKQFKKSNQVTKNVIIFQYKDILNFLNQFFNSKKKKVFNSCVLYQKKNFY